ncbi:MAG: flagellar hook-basal body protein [Clostridiales bacterium]|nr:flagellar hook-basal body protein [Clostridiales bacterium]
MISAFNTATKGLIYLQKGMDVTANNIANSNTTGYKADDTVFTDLLYTYQRGTQNEYDVKQGNGVRVQSTNTLFTTGVLTPTDDSLCYALLDDDTFFAILTEDGVKYTRNGSFQLSMINGDAYLTSASGGYVLDSNGNTIIVTDRDAKQDVGAFTFTNVNALTKRAKTLFEANDQTGEAFIKETAVIKQFYLENSNVNLADEMTDIIRLQRGFQFNSKIVQMADEIAQTINSLR